MKALKRMMLVLLSGALVTGGIAGCAPTTKGEPGILTISYYSGGYGEVWLDTLISEFTEQTGIDVVYEPSTSVIATMEAEFKNKNAYDIYISHGIPWERFAASGYLADLSDLYSSTLSDGTTFEDKVIESALEISKFNDTYYKVPYTQGVGGIVYNKTMFDANGWEVPETYDELVTLCQTIVDAKIPDGDDGFVAPFVWGGNGVEYLWDYVVYEWWAQEAGLEKINEFASYKSAEVFNPDSTAKEFKSAFELWYDLVAQNHDNSLDGSEGLTQTTSQSAFVAGKAAMMPNAHWLYNEMSELDITFEMAFMNTPTSPDAKDDTVYNYMPGFGDSIVVYKESQNLDAAKQFLLFLAEDSSLKTFTETTNGTFLAFDYTDVVLDYTKVGDNAETYIKSVKDKLDNSVNFSLYSSNPIAYMTTDVVMPWAGNNYFYSAAFNGESILLGNKEVNPDNIFDYQYDFAKKNWNIWAQAAGLM